MTEVIWLTVIAPLLRQTTWGGWNGPFPVARNDPDRYQIIMRAGNRDVQVQHSDARHSLYIEVLIAREIVSDCADTYSQSTCGEACYDIRMPSDPKRSTPDDECEPTIS
eukprot:1933171-Pyramimonas_sp.AAC.2